MTVQVKTLSLEMAETAAQAALDKAAEQDIKIAVAIMDQHGNLKVFKRMDGNNMVSVRMAQLKANSSASIPISTKALAERNKKYHAAYLGVPGLVTLEGGLPIFSKDGEHIGAIGVSGANPELDGVCAQAGHDALEKFI